MKRFTAALLLILMLFNTFAFADSTETEYKVVFRSYTGAFINFFVDRESGSTRMVEFVPALNLETEAGTINLRDYLK